MSKSSTPFFSPSPPILLSPSPKPGEIGGILFTELSIKWDSLIKNNYFQSLENNQRQKTQDICYVSF